jgi:hypothetical protein
MTTRELTRGLITAHLTRDAGGVGAMLQDIEAADDWGALVGELLILTDLLIRMLALEYQIEAADTWEKIARMSAEEDAA